MTPEQLFTDLYRADPSRPFVTYYDEASGERTELSVKSLANWVAKTHFLLTDELGLGVGDTALVAMDPHWIGYPVLLGCLTAGLALTGTDAGGATVAFVDEQHLTAAAGVPDVYAVAGGAAALGFGGTAPEGAADYVTAVRPQPDAWSLVQLTAADDDAFTADESRAEAVRRAAELAASRGVGRGARVLSTAGGNDSDGWLTALLVPLVVGGSVVLVRNADEATVARRMEQERATVTL